MAFDSLAGMDDLVGRALQKHLLPLALQRRSTSIRMTPSMKSWCDVIAAVTFLLLLFAPASAQPYRGSVTGRVVDSKTGEGISDVHVLVKELPAVGTATNVDGDFRFDGLAVGTYSLQVSAVGYAPQIVTNVVVTTGRATPLTVRLDETTIELEGVTAEGSYFARAQAMSPVSANVVQRSEVLRSPGGLQDIQRVVQMFPGVASSTDNLNELIVRGGAAYENLTMMDGMEVPSINHYPNQFNSAGPINMINADMIEDAQFSAGGFPVQYGDKASSALSLTIREGNRGAGISSKSTFNMAGIGTLIEGGFADGHGSYIFSARNSLLEVIDRIIGLSTLSLTAVPKYWDAQGKFAYDLSTQTKLSLEFLYGDSRINLAGDPKEEDELRKNVLDSSSVRYLYPVSKQHLVGMNLRTYFGKKGYSTFTLYTNGTTGDVNAREDFSRRVRGPEGEVLSSQVLNSRLYFTNYSYESFIGGKWELFYTPHPRHDLSIGIQLQTARKWRNDVFLEGDTLRFDLDQNGVFETGPIIVPQMNFHQETNFGEASKYYLYVSDMYIVTPRLSCTFGLRYDHFTYSGFGSLSPRGSITYQLAPGITSLTFAAGKYYQTQPFPFYSDRRNLGYNKSLPNMQADHFVLGIEHLLDLGLKLSVEAYYKKYGGVAVQEEFVYSAIETYWSDRFLAIGERYSYGLEFFLEQKQVAEYFGTVSLSLSRSRMKDPRIPAVTDKFPSDYDYPVIVSLLGGKVVKGVRSWLDDAPFFIKYPLYILPLSDEMEISAKYRFQTGRPYTPQHYVSWKQGREGGVKWSNGAWVASRNHNGARYADYSRLDLQWISRFYFRNWNINAYVALQNVLNRKNVFFLNYRSDGTVETVYQFSFFPVVGVEVEF